MAASGGDHAVAKVAALFVAVLGGAWLLAGPADATLSPEATAILVFVLLLLPVAAVAIPLLAARAQDTAGQAQAVAALRREALAALEARAEIADTEPVIRASTAGLLIEVGVSPASGHAIELTVRSSSTGAFAPLAADGPSGVRVEVDRVEARMAGRPTRGEIGQRVDEALRLAGQRWMHAESPPEHLERLAGEGDRLAAEALAIRRGDRRPVGARRWLIASPDPAERRRAASLLPTPDLLALADDAEVAAEVRAGAIAGLAGRPVADGADLAGRIGRWLDDGALGDAALGLLAARGASSPALAARLRALIPAGGGGYADAHRLEAIATALGHDPDPANTDPLLLLNAHPVSAVRRAALRALAAVGTPAALPRLLRLMETDDSPEMVAAVAAIRARAAAGAGGLAVAAVDAEGGLAVAEAPPPG